MGIERKRADIITEAQEEEMWSKGFLGRDTPPETSRYITFATRITFRTESWTGT